MTEKRNFEQDRNLVEQISTFKRLPAGNQSWRVAFYHIAKEFWNLPEVYVIVDKSLYEQGLKIPVFRGYKDLEGMQFFSSYNKALDFVMSNGEDFIIGDRKLIAVIKTGAFQQVFCPFFAEQQFNYILNEGEAQFIDTFERLIAVMEASDEYIVDEEQEQMLLEKNIQRFFADICEKYVVMT